MPRADLLALTEHGLVQLANAGLVKRAAREVAAGQGPQLDEAADGTIEARFADGTLTRLAPAAAPAGATCTCPASGMCRHRVALVLAYQAQAPSAVTPAAAWDPATLDLEAFEAALSASGKSELARLVATGARVELERGAVPVARLPTATVRFLVPDAIAYARCDCAAGGGCAHVAAAVRAFRAADGAATAMLGATAPSDARDDELAAAVDALLAGLLARGVVAGPAAHVDTLDRLRRLAEARRATQLRLVVAEMDEQIAAYAARSARYDEAAVLALATELFARVQVGDRASLGVGQPYETAMAKTRLVSLGARLRLRGRDAVASLALADTDTGVALLVERAFTPPDKADTFAASLPTRQLATGLQLAAAARGQILTSVARRRADGLLVLGSGARGRTALLPRDVTVSLPPPLAAAEAADVMRSLAERAPSFLAPRDRLGAMRVFAVADVLGQAWSPGSQVWQAAVRLAGDDGATLYLERAYDAAAPGALDALAAAFDGGDGTVRQIVGEVRSVSGALLCDPWSIAADRLIVPDVEPLAAQRAAPSLPSDGAAAPIDAARALLAGALHAGRRADAARRGASLAATLSAEGYLATAERIKRWLDAPPDDAGAFAAAALWVATLSEDVEPLEA